MAKKFKDWYELPSKKSYKINMGENKNVQLSKAEQYVFNYLVTLDFTEEKITIENIANGSCYSQSTVIRTLKKIGYKNFGEFKCERIYMKGVESRDNSFVLKEENIKFNLNKLEMKLNKIIKERAVVLLLENTASFYFTLLFFQSIEVDIITISDLEKLKILNNITYFSLDIGELLTYKSRESEYIHKSDSDTLLEQEYLKITLLYELFTDKGHKFSI